MRKSNENFDLTKILSETDFSQESANKDMMRNQLMFKLAHHQNNPDTAKPDFVKKFRFRPAMAIAAVLVLTFSLSMIAYGEDILRIVKEFSIGEHAKYFARDIEPVAKSFPPELKGKVFDAEGNELTAFPESEEIYTKDGQAAQLIYDASLGTLTIVSLEELEKMEEKNQEIMNKIEEIRFENIDDVRPYLAFDLAMPTALPEGFSFDHAVLSKEKNGQTLPEGESKYVSFYLDNADKTKEILVLAFLMDEETAFESYTTKDMQEVTINGHLGMLDKGRIDIEIDGVMYKFMGHPSYVSSEDLIKMAASIPTN